MIGFIIGLFVGAAFGSLLTALMVARRDDFDE